MTQSRTSPDTRRGYPILRCMGSPADIYVEAIYLGERTALYGGGSSYNVRGT